MSFANKRIQGVKVTEDGDDYFANFWSIGVYVIEVGEIRRVFQVAKE
jgi:hypothetical protein